MRGDASIKPVSLGAREGWHRSAGKPWRALFLGAFMVALALSGCRTGTGSPDESERLRALDNIEDQARLATIAANDPSPKVQMRAAQLVTDKKLLEQIVMQQNTDLQVGLFALGRIRDPRILLEIGNTTQNWSICTAALNRVPGQSERSRLIDDAEDGGDFPTHLSAVARLRLALLDPRMSARFPRVKVNIESAQLWQPYSVCTVEGERATIWLSQDGTTLARGSWSTNFPGRIPVGYHMCPEKIEAPIEPASLIETLIAKGGFPKAEREDLMGDLIPLVQHGPLEARFIRQAGRTKRP